VRIMFDAGIAFYTHRSQPAIEPRTAATLIWQPNRNPVEFATIKWRERMAGRSLPYSAHHRFNHLQGGSITSPPVFLTFLPEPL
jgi:hypothetical protein